MVDSNTQHHFRQRQRIICMVMVHETKNEVTMLDQDTKVKLVERSYLHYHCEVYR